MIPKPGTQPWIEISIDNLLYNLAEIKKRPGGQAGIMAVVKDCAYGCGAIPIAGALQKEGIDFFAVACVSEARSLRHAGIRSPILVLGAVSSPESIRWAAENRIRLTINTLSDISAFTDARSSAPIQVHLNIDSGMGRLGILPGQICETLRQLKRFEQISLEGVFTHFSCADAAETDTVSHQRAIFERALAQICQEKFNFLYTHASNSAALMRFGVTGNELARPGIALYGCRPDPRQDFGLPLRPILSLKAPVVAVRKMPAGSRVSYGATYITERDTNIATVALGYGHGYPRQLSGRGDLLIHGRRYRIAGRVTMDFIMIDAGPETAIQPGDTAVAIGSQINACITPDEIAQLCNTISYEILCALSPRLNRYYYRHDAVVDHCAGILY